MITDEQLQTVADVLNIPLSAILLRKALEAYEQSKPKPEPLSDKQVESCIYYADRKYLEHIRKAARYEVGILRESSDYFLVKEVEKAHGIGTFHELT